MKLLVTALFLILAILPGTAAAGTLSFEVSGLLGPDMQGIDPLQLAGLTFTATGEIDPTTAPFFVTADSASYELWGDLQVMVSKLPLTGYGVTLIMTAPPSGPDTVFVDFTVDEFGFSPEVIASLSLPAGTLSGTAIQAFSAEVSQPDSTLSFGVPNEEATLSGTVGLTGNVTLGGSPSPVPEPGTAGLLGAGLALAIAMKMRSQGN